MLCTSRADSSQTRAEPARLLGARGCLEPSSGLDSSRLKSLGIQLLAAQTGIHEPTRAPWQLKLARTWVHEPTRLHTRVSWQFLGGFLEARASSPRCHAPSQIEPRALLGSSRLVNNTPTVYSWTSFVFWLHLYTAYITTAKIYIMVLYCLF